MRPKQGQASGVFINSKNKVDINVPIIEFEEDNCYIIYCPALDVSGYGKTESEANQSFSTSLGAFINYTINKKTLVDELRRLGWNISN